MSLPGRALILAGAVVALAAAPAGAATNGPIAFERGGGLYSVPATGGAETVLAPPGIDYEPSYSPDGRKLAFVVNRDVYVMSASGKDRKALTTDGAFYANPAWSADGKELAYIGTGAAGRPDVFVKPVAGGAQRNITNTPTAEEREPAFSPDGRKIAFNRLGAIFVADVSGANEVNLTPENAVGGCANAPGYYFDGASREPAWSPDGTHIAFSGPLDCQVSSLGKDIWIMKADGTDKQNLTRDDRTSDADPVFSPDGTRLAFTRNIDGKVYVFTQLTDVAKVRREQIAPVQVTQGGNDTEPTWGAAAQAGEGPGCIVPKLKGRTRTAAKNALERAGCALGTVKGPKGGRVMSQTKKAGAKLEPGTKVGFKLRK